MPRNNVQMKTKIKKKKVALANVTIISTFNIKLFMTTGSPRSTSVLYDFLHIASMWEDVQSSKNHEENSILQGCNVASLAE
jgi:hypothetical protein